MPGLGLAQNVGIGTTAPAERLDVNGNIQIPSTNEYKYDGAKTGYVSVPPAAFGFAPLSATAAFLSGGTTGAFRYVLGGTTGNAAFLLAPIYLPDGARITRYVLYVYDNDATYDVYGNIYRINLATNTINNLSSTNVTSGTPLTTTVSADLSSVVDNAVYAYYVRFVTSENSSNLRLHGARVTYTVTKVD
ncbi:hypothetical protein GCM10023186_45760 [Hymenobacter koreensis]|uniref:Uncharacterized protein n=1 Tax=Hymenobacter koreensis TaxID=1084523 RepID=A0ABP8JNS4_9BACT